MPLLAGLVLVVVVADELAVSITQRRREDHLVRHFNVPLKLIELLLAATVVHDRLLARGLQHVQVTEDGLAPNAALVDCSGNLRLRFTFVWDGKVLLVQLLEEFFGRRILVEITQLAQIELRRLHIRLLQKRHGLRAQESL